MLELHRCVESSFIFDFDCGQGILSTLNTLIVYCFSPFLGKTLVCRVCPQSDHSNVQFKSFVSWLQYSYFFYLQISWKVRGRYCDGRRQWRLGPAVRKNWRVSFHFHSRQYKFHFKRCNLIVGSHSYLIRVISLFYSVKILAEADQQRITGKAEFYSCVAEFYSFLRYDDGSLPARRIIDTAMRTNDLFHNCKSELQVRTVLTLQRELNSRVVSRIYFRLSIDWMSWNHSLWYVECCTLKWNVFAHFIQRAY